MSQASRPAADDEGESVVAIAAAVRAGRRDPVAIVAGVAQRHAAIHPAINALIQPRFEAAAAEAAVIAAGPLAGVPASVKECFGVCGLQTTLGIPGRAGLIDAEDAAIVQRLRAAGGVVIGKANLPQAMYLHETDNPVWGRTNHPQDPGRGP